MLAALSLVALTSCSGGSGYAEPTATSSAAVVVCAKGATVEGVDVSHYQGSIDWKAVKGAGREFGVASVGDGSYQDPTFATNWAGMKAAGMIRGAYQFFEPGEDPVMQADIMIAKVGTLGAGDLPATLDVEVTGGQSGAVITAHIHTWVDKVKAGTGKAPIIYTGKYFWNGNVGSSDFAATPLWIAAYGVTCPDTPVPWTNWLIFQYSDKGVVSGIAGGVDSDRFNGTLAELQAFADTTPSWGAQWVSQSYPATMHVGETAPAFIELKNIGSKSWNAETHLATTVPRDRTSVFAAPKWIGPNRPAGAGGAVAPGSKHKFDFELHAPSKPGVYTEHFGVVEESVAWFSDPGEGGPKDDQIWFKIDVIEAPPSPDAGSDSGGNANDATPPLDDASARDGDSLDDGGSADAGPAADRTDSALAGGCGCALPGDVRASGASFALAAVGVALCLARRRRR